MTSPELEKLRLEKKYKILIRAISYKWHYSSDIFNIMLLKICVTKSCFLNGILIHELRVWGFPSLVFVMILILWKYSLF